MARLDDIEKRITVIEKRNAKVEMDKAWETSWSRRGLLILFTYVSIGLYMSTIGIVNPWLNAMIPSLGFLLSTLTLPFFKQWWVAVRKKS